LSEAGSSDNVALIRRGLDAFSRGAFDESMADIHEDIEWYVAFRLPDLPADKDVYRGHDEVRELWSAFSGGWESLTATLEDVVAERDDLVIVRVHWVGRGEASGVEVDRTIFYVFEIADGKLLRLRPFDDEAEALQAAGL
jgi:ketosteroid isomerase-like protein